MAFCYQQSEHFVHFAMQEALLQSRCENVLIGRMKLVCLSDWDVSKTHSWINLTLHELEY